MGAANRRAEGYPKQDQLGALGLLLNVLVLWTT
jgi:hypothetical protein